MGMHEFICKGAAACSYNSGPLLHSQLVRCRRPKKKMTNSHRLILQHYQARCTRVIEDEGVPSPIRNLKRLHAWITWWLINLYTKGGEFVLDLACGKGGDLMKWEKAGVGHYVGVDIVQGLLEAARRRHVASGCSYPARFICSDGYGASLQECLRNEGPFDVCSCQFALHYAWSSEQRARAALRNVADLLKPGAFFIGTLPDADMILKKLKDAGAAAAARSGGGGVVVGGCKGEGDGNGGGQALEFGNKLYKVKFDEANCKRALSMSGGGGQNRFGIQYEFYLADAVDHCPEWLVPLAVLKGLAQEYGLELVSSANFHDFLHEQAQRQHQHQHQHHHHKLAQHALSLPPFPPTFQSSNMQLLADSAAHSSTSPEEWECVSLYLIFAFQKRVAV